MRFQAVNRCLMASVWWASDFRLSTLGLILVIQTSAVPMNVLLQRLDMNGREWRKSSLVYSLSRNLEMLHERLNLRVLLYATCARVQSWSRDAYDTAACCTLLQLRLRLRLAPVAQGAARRIRCH